MACLNHICLTFLRDKCDNRFVSHLGHLIVDKSYVRFVLDLSLRQISLNPFFRPVIIEDSSQYNVQLEAVQ